MKVQLMGNTPQAIWLNEKEVPDARVHPYAFKPPLFLQVGQALKKEEMILLEYYVKEGVIELITAPSRARRVIRALEENMWDLRDLFMAASFVAFCVVLFFACYQLSLMAG